MAISPLAVRIQNSLWGDDFRSFQREALSQEVAKTDNSTPCVLSDLSNRIDYRGPKSMIEKDQAQRNYTNALSSV